MAVPSLWILEQALGLNFNDKALLRRAFVHRSYLNELLDDHADLADNERLEFLGDAVIGYITAERLYRLFPDLQEGELTNLRAALIRRETLSRLALDLHLGDYLLLGHGEEESGGRTRPATLCAVFEALIGAIYVDQGIDVAKRIVLALLAQDIGAMQGSEHTKDAKSRLQEWAQPIYNFTPRYRVAQSIGPDHAKSYVMLVLINGQPHGVGQGRSKQEATQKAAAMALHRGGQPAPEYEANPELERQYGLE